MRKYRVGDNPIGAHVRFTQNERKYLVEITGAYREQGYTARPMFTTRHLNGEPGPDVCAFAVEMLERECND